jgi:hypothetical protein
MSATGDCSSAPQRCTRSWPPRAGPGRGRPGPRHRRRRRRRHPDLTDREQTRNRLNSPETGNSASARERNARVAARKCRNRVTPWTT